MISDSSPAVASLKVTLWQALIRTTAAPRPLKLSKLCSSEHHCLFSVGKKEVDLQQCFSGISYAIFALSDHDTEDYFKMCVPQVF